VGQTKILLWVVLIPVGINLQRSEFSKFLSNNLRVIIPITHKPFFQANVTFSLRNLVENLIVIQKCLNPYAIQEYILTKGVLWGVAST